MERLRFLLYNRGVSGVVEKPWFKWVVIGLSSLTFLGVIASGLLQEYFYQREIERIELEKFNAQKDYEDEFQSWMTRIYQNLKLDHFLAAHQNVLSMPKPKKNDGPRVEEYLEALHRVGRGLLTNGLLREAEFIYAVIREYDFESNQANSALTEIESRRKLMSAQTYIRDGRRFVEEGKFRNAMAELQKADIELNTVKTNNFELLKNESEELNSLSATARFYVRIEDADIRIAAARAAFSRSDFDKTQEEMSKAANLIGRAAFLRPTAPEVETRRQALRDLEVDLAYAIPNSMPLWNKNDKRLAGRDTDFFFLESYDLQQDPADPTKMKISLSYLRTVEPKTFIVRYRVFYKGGQNFFNGHFLTPPKDGYSDHTTLGVIYEQEVPERFRGMPVERIEVNVFNEYDEIVSRVMRAFKVNS